MNEIITTQKTRAMLRKAFGAYNLSNKSGTTWFGTGFTITKSDDQGFVFIKRTGKTATVRIDYKTNLGAGSYNAEFAANERANREKMLNQAKELFHAAGFKTVTNFDGRGFVVVL